MPALPELGETARKIRRRKVGRQVDPKQCADAPYQAGVPGKVVVEHHRIDHQPDCQLRRPKGRWLAEYLLGQKLHQAVGDHNLAHQSYCDQRQCVSQGLVVDHPSRRQLRHKRTAAFDRSGRQAWEIDHVERKFDHIPGRFSQPAAHIQQVRDCLHNIEGETQRQQQGQRGRIQHNINALEIVDHIGDEEISMLEIDQRRQIDADAGPQYHPLCISLTRQSPREPIIGRSKQPKDQHISQSPHRQKRIRSRQQQDVLGAPRQKVIQGQNCQDKDKECGRNNRQKYPSAKD